MTAGVPASRTLRLTAILLFVGLPLALATVTGLNLLRLADLSDQTEMRTDLLRRLEQRIARLGVDGTSTADTSAIYLDGETQAVARAGLQQRLVAMVNETSGKLIEAQEVDKPDADPSDADDNSDVLLRVAFDARNAGLLDLLYRIETGLPLLTVRSIMLRTLPGQAEGGDQDPTLRVDLVVEGHTRSHTS